MKFSALKDLTAPLVINYRGAEINLRYRTEKLYEEQVRAQLAALEARPAEESAPASLPDESEQAALTPAQETAARKERQLRAAREEAELLQQLIASWDLLGDDDAPLPVTVELLIGCGPILRAIMAREITADIFRPLNAAS